MDTKQQEYFIAIAEEGSLSKAARRLYISQPSLSQYLTKLESSMNVQLFTRGRNNHITLTGAGKLYYESAQEIVRIRDDFIRKLSDLKDSASSNLTFGINGERGVHIMTQIVASLSERYPDLHIITQRYSADELAQLVESNNLDIAYSAFDFKRSKLNYIEFPPREVMLVMAGSHSRAHLGTTAPLSGLPRMSLGSFSNEIFVLLKEGTVLRRVQDAYCQQVGVCLNTKIETHDVKTAFSIISSSSCVGLCPYNLIPDINDMQLSYIGLDPPMHYRTGVYYNKTVYQTKFMRDFLSIARKLATAALPSN